MMDWVYLWLAFCLAGMIFLFIVGCETLKDYEKKFAELEIKIFHKYCDELKDTIENLCNSFNAMREHSNDICNEMDEYAKQLDQMGEALQKHITDDFSLKSKDNSLKPMTTDDLVKWLEHRMSTLHDLLVELDSKGVSNSEISDLLGVSEECASELRRACKESAPDAQYRTGCDCIIDEVDNIGENKEEVNND